MAKTTKTAATLTTTPPSPDRSAPVTEVELAALKRDRALLDGLKAQAQALAKNLDEREEDIIARIESGAEVLGDVRPVVQIVSRKNVSWMTELAKTCARLGVDGKEEIRRIKDAAAVSFSKVLQIP